MENSKTSQVIWISIGSLFSFGFSIISSMILARYLSKSDYGTYKQVLYIYNTLLVLFTLGVPKAFSFFLPRVPLEEAKSLINRITSILIILGFSFSIFIYVFSDIISLILKNRDLSYVLKYFSIIPALMLPTMGLEGIFATYQKIQLFAGYTIISRVIILAFVALPVIFWKSSVSCAIIGFIIGSFISAVLAIYLRSLPIKKYPNHRCGISYTDIFRFSIPLVFAGIWGLIISSVDQLLISRYFGREIFADFSNGFMDLPFIGMVITSCSTVLLPFFSKKLQAGSEVKSEIYNVWISVIDKTIKITYPLILFCFVYSTNIMVILYGDIYWGAGIYFKLRLCLNLFMVISYSPLILALGKTRFYATVHMLGAFFLISADVLVISIFDNPIVIALVSVICQLGMIFTMLNFTAKFLNKSIIRLFPFISVFKILASSCLSLLVLCLINTFLPLFKNEVLLISLLFVVYIIVYFSFVRIMKLDYSFLFKPFVSKLRKCYLRKY